MTKQEIKVFNKWLAIMLTWAFLMFAALAITAYFDLRMAKYVTMIFLPVMPFIVLFQISQMRAIRGSKG